MAAYIARRLAFAAFLVFSVSSASFVLTRLAPGDYVAYAKLDASSSPLASPMIPFKVR